MVYKEIRDAAAKEEIVIRVDVMRDVARDAMMAVMIAEMMDAITAVRIRQTTVHVRCHAMTMIVTADAMIHSSRQETLQTSRAREPVAVRSHKCVCNSVCEEEESALAGSFRMDIV